MRHVTGARHCLTRVLAAVGMLSFALACADPVPTGPVPNPRPVASGSVAAAVPSVAAIGNIMGYGVNDAGVIVGPSDGNHSSAYLWSSAGLTLLGMNGLAWDLSQNGLAVGGKNAAGVPVLWTATSLAGPWTEVPMPDAGGGGAVRAMVSDASGAPVLMTGNVWTNGINKTPAKWTPCTSGPGCPNGWLLTTITPTAPITEAWGQDINPSGMIVGMEGTGCCRAAFWDGNGAQTVLPPLLAGGAASAWGINDAGTVIVGQSNGVAVMWIRASTTVSFGAPTRLDATACKGNGGSIAYAVNPDLVGAGTVVGQACGSPVAWKVDVSAVPVSSLRVALPSTGRSTAGVAQSINRATAGSLHRIAGQVNGTGVYWTNF
jgi:uncharacterized membrane protein